ncbi:MAG: GlmU family protein [Rhizobacter sp.]|nr:GlmU family protein [Chlorobiales bacterium]
MNIILFEDEAAEKFSPLALLRPVYELRTGIRSLREKFEHHLAPQMETPLALHCRPHLAPVWRENFPGVPINVCTERDTLFVNGRVVCDDAFAKKILSGNLAEGKAYFNGGQLIAFRCIPKELFGETLPEKIEAKFISEKLSAHQLDCTYVAFLWDLIRLHASEFTREINSLPHLGEVRGQVHPRATLVNEKKIFIAEGADIRAGAVLDATDGAIAVMKGASVWPNAVLMQGVFIGEGSTVKIGAKIYEHVYLGKRCKAGGEIEASIFDDCSNKQHDGFVGHSYISSWCNLGADTNTSDLKNNYGAVRMNSGGKEIDTKMTFLGLIMGEHSKSAIGTMFNTGALVGMSSNIFGAGFPPKTIGSFQWGGAENKSVEKKSAENKFVRYELEKALDVAKVVMKRRGLTMSEEYESLFRTVFERESTGK